MDDNNPPSVEQSAWNLSQMLIFQISQLLQEASLFYTKGNVRKAYFKTREIRFLIHADLTEEEIKECKRLEKLFSVLPSKRPMRAVQIQEYFLTKYREEIFNLLKKYGYLVSKKEESTRMF